MALVSAPNIDAPHPDNLLPTAREDLADVLDGLDLL